MAGDMGKEPFGTLNAAITYCNSDSKCTGIYRVFAFRDRYYVMAGRAYQDSTSRSDCSWVRNSYSKILINMKWDMQ